jgi:hypothetical protein
MLMARNNTIKPPKTRFMSGHSQVSSRQPEGGV